MKPNSKAKTQQRGFTLTQMVVTVAIIAVVSVFGVLGIKTARAEFRLQNSARLFATYVEKARADAIRRHAASGQESSIETFGPGNSTYAITMDFGAGTVETRIFDLENGLTFSTAAKKVTFDWRGRITEAWVFQIFSDYLARSLPVDVSGSGDITVGEQHFPDQLIPPVEIAEVTGDVESTPTPTPTPTPSPSGTPPVDPGGDTGDPTDPTPTPTPTPSNNGNGNGTPAGGSDGNNGNSNPTPTPTPASSPSPSPGGTQCTSSISPTELFLSQSDSSKMSGSAIFTITNGTGVRIISASQLGNGNAVTLGLSLQRIDGSGSSVVTVTTKHGAGNRGVFVVQVAADPACGSAQQLQVTINN
jgi:prepilin-type N-terminal cleavage/methylation domain-containing protein